MSKDYEHTVANGIHGSTDDETRAYRIGFSGSSNKPNPDVLVTTPRDCYGLEIKRTSQDTFYIDGEDLQQLVACENSYTSVWLVVKFTYLEPVCIRYYDDVTGADWSKKTVIEKFAALTPDCFDSSVTDGGNLRLDKPDTDAWTSSKAGVDDHIAILRDCGILNPESRVI